jgi:hypothetical protein
LAHFIVGLPWVEAFLVGAVLSPTDPSFAAAIVGHEEVPARLRYLLNVESGLNAWSIVDPIGQHWEANVPQELPNYAAATWGPAAVDALLRRDGRAWLVL